MTRRLIGIGNPDRGDDAAGWEVAGRVSSWQVERRSAASFDLVDLWEPEDDVVIVDAMRSGAEAGTVARFDAVHEELPLGTFSSTHAFGPAAVVELARAMGMLPGSLTVIGIEADELSTGADMSPPVAHAVTMVAEELQHA